MLWIEIHQPRASFVIHQSLTTTAVQIVVKSTLSPRDQYQSDDRGTTNKTKLFIHITSSSNNLYLLLHYLKKKSS